jgi:dienelactone hydrolase
MRRHVSLLIGLCLVPFGSGSGQSLAEDLNCLTSPATATVMEPTWYAALQKQAVTSLRERGEEVERLAGNSQLSAYQQSRRDFMLEKLGGPPPSTPVNGQVVGRLPRRGYAIEKIIFESQPHHHVTGNLYLPDGPGPFPAVLVSSGHSRTAKAADYNQRFGIIFAQHGLAAFCIDPIGQGERSQVLLPDGQPQYPGTTFEHLLMGTGSILVGRNTATYRVWDAMRAIDYLLTRPDIDAQRIGMTGCSGGGTLTSYVMALDQRVGCAAPSCYLTNWEKLIATVGPQDAEQNIHAQIGFGLDHPDYVLLRAPQPTLISATAGDYFEIQGTWETYRQAKRFYARLGFPERVDLVEADGKHGVQPINLAAITQWMRRWLTSNDEPVAVPDFTTMETLTEAELRCTERGQVLSLASEKSVFDLNHDYQQTRLGRRRAAWQTASAEERRRLVCELAGIRWPLTDATGPALAKGTIARTGYQIEKWVLRGESAVPLPALVFRPDAPKPDVYLYLHDRGKVADSEVNGPIEAMVRAGHLVMTVDLRGQGETGHGTDDPLLGDWKTFYLAYLQGQSQVGAHAEDILTAAQWLTQTQAVAPGKLHGLAVGSSCVAALHAAIVAPDRFGSLRLRDGPASWAEGLSHPAHGRWLTTTIHGVLEHYDLPDLIQSLGPERVHQP